MKVLKKLVAVLFLGSMFLGCEHPLDSAQLKIVSSSPESPAETVVEKLETVEMAK